MTFQTSLIKEMYLFIYNIFQIMYDVSSHTHKFYNMRNMGWLSYLAKSILFPNFWIMSF